MSPADPTDRSAPDTGRLLALALCLGVVLVLPTYGMLGVTTDPGLWAWFGVFIGVTAAAALVAHFLVVRGAALALLVVAGYAIAVLIALAGIAAIGDPPERGALALLAGLPAAAVAALLAVVVHSRAGATAGATLAPVALVLLIGFGFAPEVGRSLDDARGDAELARELEATSLTPLLPEFDGLEPDFVGRILQDDRTVGYAVDYQPDPDRTGSPTLTVRNPGNTEVLACEGSMWECEEHDGFYLLSRDGVVEYVVDDIHGLSAEYPDDHEGLPDPEEIGAALSDADTVEWSEIAQYR